MFTLGFIHDGTRYTIDTYPYNDVDAFIEIANAFGNDDDAKIFIDRGVENDYFANLLIPADEFKFLSGLTEDRMAIFKQAMQHRTQKILNPMRELEKIEGMLALDSPPTLFQPDPPGKEPAAESPGGFCCTIS